MTCPILIPYIFIFFAGGFSGGQVMCCYQSFCGEGHAIFSWSGLPGLSDVAVLSSFKLHDWF